MTLRSITPIEGLVTPLWWDCFVPLNRSTMTIGRKFASKDKTRSMDRLLDYRTRSILQAISTEPRGKALGAYLRSIAERTGR